MDSFMLLRRVTGLAVVNPMELSFIASSLGLNAADLARIKSQKYKYTLTLTARGWFILADKRVTPTVFLVWHEALKLRDCVPNISRKLSLKRNGPATQLMPEIRLLRFAEDV